MSLRDDALRAEIGKGLIDNEARAQRLVDQFRDLSTAYAKLKQSAAAASLGAEAEAEVQEAIDALKAKIRTFAAEL